MKTIKERAKELCKEYGLYGDGYSICMEIALKITTEQKAIDIDKAINAHCSVCEFYNECKEKKSLMQCGSCLFIRSKMEE